MNAHRIAVFAACLLVACASPNRSASSAMPPADFKVAGLDEPLHFLSGTAPIPPANQLPPAQIEASVRVRYSIDEQGRTRDIVVMRSNNELFSSAVVSAVAGFRFAPPKRAGRVVTHTNEQEFVFKVD